MVNRCTGRARDLLSVSKLTSTVHAPALAAGAMPAVSPRKAAHLLSSSTASSEVVIATATERRTGAPTASYECRSDAGGSIPKVLDSSDVTCV